MEPQTQSHVFALMTWQTLPNNHSWIWNHHKKRPMARATDMFFFQNTGILHAYPPHQFEDLERPAACPEFDGIISRPHGWKLSSLMGVMLRLLSGSLSLSLHGLLRCTALLAGYCGRKRSTQKHAFPCFQSTRQEMSWSRKGMMSAQQRDLFLSYSRRQSETSPAVLVPTTRSRNSPVLCSWTEKLCSRKALVGARRRKRSLKRVIYLSATQNCFPCPIKRVICTIHWQTN